MVRHDSLGHRPGQATHGRRSRFRVVAAPTALVVAAALGLAGCGGSGGNGGKAASGDTYTYAMTGVPTSLDPANYQGDPSRDIGYEEGSNIVVWDTSKLPNAGCDKLPTVDDLRGDLAKSWERSSDEKTITVTLNDRKSAAGNELTANDVKWTIDRLIALEVATPDTLMHTIAHWAADPISVVDDHTFQIHVEQPTAMDLAILSWPQFRILDSTEVKKHVTDQDKWGGKFLDTTSANFGPWVNAASDFDPGNKLTLHQNPNYTGERGDVKTLVMQSVPDASGRAQLLETGNADYAASLQWSQYASLKNSSHVELQTCASADRIPLVLNAKNKNLANPDVRRAISMAIDRDALVKSAFSGFNQAAKYGLSQSYGYTSDKSYSYDVDGAKALMQQSGVKPFSITLIQSPARPGPEAEQIAILLKSQLAKIGVTVKIQTQASATDLNTTFHDGTYEAMIYLEPPAISDPYYSLFLYNSSESSLNQFGYKNTEFDADTAKIATTNPGPDRDALIQRAMDIVVDDPPMIYLVDKQFVHAVAKGWTNYQHAPNGEIFVYTLKHTS
jgi:peptide/nickel transport system substrate-binding protein